MTEPIRVRARKFLKDFFNDEELDTFCFDYFPQVLTNFTLGMTLNQKILILVSYSQRRDSFNTLLAALKRERPEIYPKYFDDKPILVDPEPQPLKTIEHNPNQIFISHAHQDAKYAQRLAANLRTKNWQTWMASDDIRPGEKWVEAINRGLLESGVFVLVSTPDAMASRWVQREMNAAIELEDQGKMRLFTLNVKSADMPPLWSGYQWIALADDYEAGLAVLLNELESHKKSKKATRPLRIPKDTQETSNISKNPITTSPQHGIINEGNEEQSFTTTLQHTIINEGNEEQSLTPIKNKKSYSGKFDELKWLVPIIALIIIIIIFALTFQENGQFLFSPTDTPTPTYTLEPTVIPLPTETPTQEPTEIPTLDPTESPTLDPTESPTLKPTESPLPTDTACLQAQVQITYSSANIRSGPGTNYSIIQTGHKNETMPILAQTEDASWYFIELEGDESGWIWANAIKLISPSGCDSEITIIPIKDFPPLPTLTNTPIPTNTPTPTDLPPPPPRDPTPTKSDPPPTG